DVNCIRQQDDIDERVAACDFLAFDGLERALPAGLAVPHRETIHKRLAEDAELTLERVLQHAVDRLPHVLETIILAHRVNPSDSSPRSAIRGPEQPPMKIARCRLIVFETVGGAAPGRAYDDNPRRSIEE